MSVEIRDALGGIKPGNCIGHWSTSASECIGCAFAMKCSEITSRRKSGEAAVGPTEPETNSEDIESIPPTAPLEYLLRTLEGRLDRVTKTDGKFRAEYFNKPDGETGFLVVVDPNGRIMVSSSKGKRVFEKLESHEEVEKVLKELS